MMHTPSPTIDSLLAAFENHQQLRRSGASISELSASRARLDQLRLDVRRAIG